MSQLTVPRAYQLRAKQAWIDTGLRYFLTAVCAGSAGLHAALIQPQDELTGNYTASIADYEAIHLHILALADLLSSGIMHQFPGRFA